MSQTLEKNIHMRRALALAGLGQGWVEPNPMVGALIVRDGQVIGQGYHRAFGQAHAEVEALEDCRRRGQSPRGATMLVTLEPCSHHGQTPPCVQAIIQAGLSRVVVAMTDPSAHASGRGLEALAQAGIDLDVGVQEQQARTLNAPFIKRMTTALPWVIVKWAQTLDGYNATSTGQSQWISNETSRQHVHQLRARMDAIITGMGSALADDPRLTARNVPIKRHARRIIVGDPQTFHTPPASTLSMLNDQGPPVEIYPHQHDLYSLLRNLARDHQATNVLIEAGGGLVGSLLAQGLVDQILAYIGPKLLGDSQAKPVIRGLHAPTLPQATALHLEHVETLGGDVLLDYRLTTNTMRGPTNGGQGR